MENTESSNLQYSPVEFMYIGSKWHLQICIKHPSTELLLNPLYIGNPLMVTLATSEDSDVHERINAIESILKFAS